MTTEQILERFIVKELMIAGDDTKLAHDQSLISSGILDSLALLQLVEFIDEEFGASIEDEELLPENFQTINDIAALIQRKTAESNE